MLHNRFRITFSAACFTCCLAAFFLSACGAVNASAPTDAASPEPASVPTPAPTAYITLDAGAALEWPCGIPFSEPGFTAHGADGADISARVACTGEVDCMTPGDYCVSYSVCDDGGSSAAAERCVSVVPVTLPETAAEENVIYLTFDDGPCRYTEELLDVLDKYGAQATFFVLAGNNAYLDLLPRIYEAGHSIGVHACCHDYDRLYSSAASYLDDLAAARQTVYELTGEYVDLCRFPGGSTTAFHKLNNREKGAWEVVTAQLERMGMRYFDWNVSPENSVNSGEASVNAVINFAPRYEVPVSLQHDTRLYSVRCVERILKWGTEHGYTFKGLDTAVPPVQNY